MLKLAIFALVVSVALGFPKFQEQIPNGKSVPDPCAGQSGNTWRGVGHNKEPGGGSRNVFGLAFKAAGFKWTTELCQKDSDMDGRTNGQELGDPDCKWSEGGTPTGPATGHPGICEPMSDDKCKSVNADINCPS